MANKYIVVRGKRIRYDSRFDFRPYCFFDIPNGGLDMTLDAVRHILSRCRKVFKSADFSSIKILRKLNNCYECKVIFSISEDERLAYERKVKDAN